MRDGKVNSEYKTWNWNSLVRLTREALNNDDNDDIGIRIIPHRI
jgi:hypothetical protein